MNNTVAQSLSYRGWQKTAPEYMLLLSIFGGTQTRQQIDEELDRRALRRPTRLFCVTHPSKLPTAA
jgi:hypothetical protein